MMSNMTKPFSWRPKLSVHSLFFFNSLLTTLPNHTKYQLPTIIYTLINLKLYANFKTHILSLKPNLPLSIYHRKLNLISLKPLKMPSLLYSMFSCFSNSKHQVVCEDQASHVKDKGKRKEPQIKRSSAPIPMSYFPSGSSFSRL